MERVIYLDSSDDEEEPVRVRSQNLVAVNCKVERDMVPSGEGDPRGANGAAASQSQDPSSAALMQIKGKMSIDDRLAPQPQPQGDTLCRQFWQAGNYEDHPPKRRRIVQGAMDHVRVHPKFLHSNATSHKWALGAIAELLDNSVDEIVNGATFCYVDKITSPRDGNAALLIQDDGGGMTPDALRQCMSLGFSQKNAGTTIGQYGNGFKTSTMRLGADVIVLTRKESENGLVTQSAGLLSYTFLRKTGHEDIVVPMLDYKYLGDGVKPAAFLRSNMDDWLSNLATITRWSPYCSEDELLKQFGDIGKHGTKVIIFNLWRDDDDDLELDFDTDPHDIKLRVASKEKAKKANFQTALVEEHISSRYRLSLRVYASILYLRMPENFRIILRGNVVEHHNIVDDLKYRQILRYRPQDKAKEKEFPHKDVSVLTTVGFTKEAPMVNVHGYNIYHKNRLIMPFWKVFHENSSRGRGVVGVLQVDFIEPAHDKQDFERTALFIKLETRLKQITMEYWHLHCHLLGYKPAVRAKPGPKPISSTSPTFVPQIEATAPVPVDAPEALTSPTSSLANNVQEKQAMEGQTQNPNAIQNDEGNHSASTSTSGPSTPDGLVGDKMAEGLPQRMGLDKVAVKVEEGSQQSKGTKDLEEILSEIRLQNRSDPARPLVNGEAGSMTISPENGALLTEILEQNTILREKCADYEKREKHWELNVMVYERLAQEHRTKIAELEKELLALRMMGQVQNVIPDAAAHVPEAPEYQQLQPLNNNVKFEFS